MTTLRKQEQGLRIIAPGTDPVADAVFIHGLQGHPRTSWLFGTDPDAPQKSHTRVFNSLKHKLRSTDDAQSSKQSGFFWPKEALARDFPALRIAAYGYDSHVSNFFSGPASQTTIVGHGRSLLNELVSFRRDISADRPIIFVAHSLGGLVLKEAQRRAYKAESYEHEWRAIYEATQAILFFGTPHCGTPSADWGLVARNIVSAVGFDASNSVLRDLQVDASILDSLREDFSKILREESFWVFTFMEANGFKGFRGQTTKTVSDVSASLGYAREQKYYINANHVEMCRFCGSADKDNGYRHVKDAIAVSLKGRPPVAPRPDTNALFPARRRYHVSKRKQILDILKVDTSYSLRYEQVEVAFGESFSWLFTKEELGFEKWLREGGALYWIRGLPATGKSTLMKMAYQHERTKTIMRSSARKRLQAEFFFHDRGSVGQKSFTGLIHGILYQILSTEPELLSCMEEHFESCFGFRLDVEPTKAALLLTHEVVWTAFQLLLQQTSTSVDIFLFLDALDEYSGAKAEIADFVKAIASSSSTNASLGTKIHVCFSSRPNNDLLDHFGPLALPGFDIKDHTTQDIEIVVRTMICRNHRMLSVLDSGSDGEKVKVTRFRHMVCARAEGVFLWVRLVLQDILQEYTDGKGLDELISLLAMLPSDLEQYYSERIIDRIPIQHRDDSLTMIDIVRCAVRPLTVSDFYYIFLNAHKSDLHHLIGPTEPVGQLPRNLERLLRSRAGGLVEISKASDYTSELRVQFIHLTVKTWAAKASTRGRISQGLALRSTGFEYYSRYGVSRLNSWLNKDRKMIESEIDETPLGLEEDFLEHCAIAEHETGAAQTEILIEARDHSFLLLYNSMMWAGEMKRETISDLLSFAVAAELENFLSAFTAIRTPSERSLDSALRIAVELPDNYTVRLSDCARRARIVQLLLDLDANADSVERGVTIFQRLWIRSGSRSTRHVPEAQIVRKFLEHGQNPNIVISYKERIEKRKHMDRETSPLHLACRKAQLDTVRLLLYHGASVNTLDSQRQTPLDCAAHQLGARIQSFLSQEVESVRINIYQEHENATDLQDRLVCISMLLDAGAKLSHDPYVVESIYDDFHFAEPVIITQAHVDALLQRGFDVDSRVLNLPKHGQGLVQLLGKRLSVLSTARNWLVGGH